MEWAVSEVQKQQAESLVRMEALRKQHLDWEAAVKSMLQQIRDTFSEEVETSARVELKRGSSTLSQRSTHFAGARELQKLRNSTARQDSPPVAIASSPTAPSAPSGPALGVRRHRTRSSENSRMLEEILSQPGSPERPRSNRIQGVLAWIVESTVFECVTGLVILLNMILIGAEAEMKVKGQVIDWAENIERFFLALYTVELLMRFAVGRWRLFRSGWFLLDFFLVCLGLLALVVIPTIDRNGCTRRLRAGLDRTRSSITALGTCAPYGAQVQGGLAPCFWLVERLGYHGLHHWFDHDLALHLWLRCLGIYHH